MYSIYVSFLQVKVWDTSSGFCYVTFDQHSGGVTDVTFIESGKAIVSCSQDGTVRAFDLNRWVFVHIYILLGWYTAGLWSWQVSFLRHLWYFRMVYCWPLIRLTGEFSTFMTSQDGIVQAFDLNRWVFRIYHRCVTVQTFDRDWWVFHIYISQDGTVCACDLVWWVLHVYHRMVHCRLLLSTGELSLDLRHI